MIRRPLLPLFCVLVASLCWSTGLHAWGYEIHRFIADRAIAELPPDIRPFYEKNRVFFVEHSVDPDLWRSAGFEEEPPRHFVDLDTYGQPPFAALPRDFDLAVAKFGREKVEQNGTLPWRAAEIYDDLVKAFSQMKAGTSPYAPDNAKFFSAVLAHYVADAHVPFHAIINYDGQLTQQQGIHARFETELFLRYRDRLRIDPPKMPPVDKPVDFVFETLIDSFKFAGPLLEADRRAIGTGDTYDDQYFDRFFSGAQPTLGRQLSRAIGAVAAVITGAWEAGGRPELPLNPVPRPARKKRTTSQP